MALDRCSHFCLPPQQRATRGLRRRYRKIPGYQGLLEGERGDSNPRPPGPQPGALPAELRPPRRPLNLPASRRPLFTLKVVTKLHDEFTIALPVKRGSFACLDAIATVGWDARAAGPDRIVAKIGVGVTRNPSKIEVLLSESGDQTMVRLNGSIIGIGPPAKRPPH